MSQLIIPTLDELEAIYGFEEGTNEFADVITQSVDGADLNAMWREFQAAINLLNRQRDPLVQLLTFRVGNPVERILRPSDEEFEEATQFGEPRGIRLPTPFVAGYDFRWYDLATRFTWLFLLESTQAQIEGLHSSVLEADNRLVFTKVFRTVFNPTNSSAIINQQNVTVYRFYNADGMVPPSYKGTDFDNTHTHYLGSNAATIDSGDLDDIEEHLYHHGYRLTLGYKLVLLVNRQEGTEIRTFSRANGDKYDFIPAQGVGGGMFLPPNSGVVGAPTGSPGIAGMIGSYGPWLVVEEDYIPAGYVFGFATGGEQSLGNVVGIREHEQASARGLRLMKGPDKDYPLTDAFYQHGLGTGVRHRGGGVVMQIHAGTSYTVPPIYA